MRACVHSPVAIELGPEEGRFGYSPTADAAFSLNSLLRPCTGATRSSTRCARHASASSSEPSVELSVVRSRGWPAIAGGIPFMGGVDVKVDTTWSHG